MHISPAFLTLPPEIRTKIYRLLFCLDDPIFTYVNLSAAFLRTCRQILSESRPILYGENIFEMQILDHYENGEQAYFLRCDHFAQDAELMFGPRLKDMRRFEISVRPHHPGHP
jgi:hypothetical protein